MQTHKTPTEPAPAAKLILSVYFTYMTSLLLCVCVCSGGGGGGAKPILTGELKRSKITRSVYEAKMVLAVVLGKKNKTGVNRLGFFFCYGTIFSPGLEQIFLRSLL